MAKARPVRLVPWIAFVSTFAFTVLAGVALTARATVPCNPHEQMTVEVSDYQIDGVEAAAPPARVIRYIASDYSSETALYVQVDDETVEGGQVEILVQREAP